LGASKLIKFESFKRFLNVSFWHNFVILVKIALLSWGHAILIMHANFFLVQLELLKVGNKRLGYLRYFKPFKIRTATF